MVVARGAGELLRGAGTVAMRQYKGPPGDKLAGHSAAIPFIFGAHRRLGSSGEGCIAREAGTKGPSQVPQKSPPFSSDSLDIAAA